MNSKDICSLQESYLSIYESHSLGELDEAEKWIQKAIKKPGALSKQLGVPEKENIPAKTLKFAAKKGGKLGKRARLAMTLKGFRKEEIDLYDVLFTHLLDEGYADTELSAAAIIECMSEEWRDDILEGEKPLPYGRMMKKSDELSSSEDPKKQKRAAKIYLAANAPKGPKVKIRK